jgi:hypothetical protein
MSVVGMPERRSFPYRIPEETLPMQRHPRFPARGLVILFLSLFASAAHAATVGFRLPASTALSDPADFSRTAGETWSLVLAGEGFQQPLDGGGVSLEYDPDVLEVTDVAVNTARWEFFSDPGTRSRGRVEDTVFNTFNPGTGPFEFATYTLKAVGVGITELDLRDSRNPFASDGHVVPIDYTRTTIEVAPIPLPGAAWLLAPAAGALLSRKRGRRD